MITYHGTVGIPPGVTAAAQPIKLLNYKTTTPAKFQKNTLTPQVAGQLLEEVANLVGQPVHRLDYVYFSAAQGAEPHVDLLPPDRFTPRTFVIPVLLPKGTTTITALDHTMAVQLGGVYEFDHEQTHSMQVQDPHSGCVLIMVAVKL